MGLGFRAVGRRRARGYAGHAQWEWSATEATRRSLVCARSRYAAAAFADAEVREATRVSMNVGVPEDDPASIAKRTVCRARSRARRGRESVGEIGDAKIAVEAASGPMHEGESGRENISAV
jgi:hypothetical protein